MRYAMDQAEAELGRYWKRTALRRQDGGCKYCWRPLTNRTATIDHRIPRARGGQTLPENIDALCRDCNGAKGKLTAAAFVRAIETPDLLRDGTRLYMACVIIRTQRRVESAVRRIRALVPPPPAAPRPRRRFR